MLPAKNRLAKKDDIQKIHRTGTFFKKESIRIKALKNGLTETRFCIIAGLDFSKKATRRNQVKRRIRAYLGRNIAKIFPGWDIIVIIKKADQKDESDQQLINDLHEILRQNHFISRN